MHQIDGCNALDVGSNPALAAIFSIYNTILLCAYYCPLLVTGISMYNQLCNTIRRHTQLSLQMIVVIAPQGQCADHFTTQTPRVSIITLCTSTCLSGAFHERSVWTCTYIVLNMTFTIPHRQNQMQQFNPGQHNSQRARLKMAVMWVRIPRDVPIWLKHHCDSTGNNRIALITDHCYVSHFSTSAQIHPEFHTHTLQTHPTHPPHTPL